MKENDYITICDIVAKNLKIDPNLVTLKSDILNDLDGDSLNKVEIIIELEKTFKISIPDDIVTSYVTVEDLAKFIYENT